MVLNPTGHWSNNNSASYYEYNHSDGLIYELPIRYALGEDVFKEVSIPISDEISEFDLDYYRWRSESADKSLRQLAQAPGKAAPKQRAKLYLVLKAEEKSNDVIVESSGQFYYLYSKKSQTCYFNTSPDYEHLIGILHYHNAQYMAFCQGVYSKVTLIISPAPLLSVCDKDCKERSYSINKANAWIYEDSEPTLAFMRTLMRDGYAMTLADIPYNIATGLLEFESIKAADNVIAMK